MRLFFGVLLKNSDKKRIIAHQNRLKESFDGKYTREDNLHVTLVYVGECDEKVSYMLSQIGDMVFSDICKFSIETDGVNSFKGGEVTYLGVAKNDVLKSYYNSLISLLDRANIEYSVSDEYRPHITLRRGKKYDIAYDCERETFEVGEVCLLESKRVDGVLRYIPIKSWRASDYNGD